MIGELKQIFGGEGGNPEVRFIGKTSIGNLKQPYKASNYSFIWLLVIDRC